jgi:hypothetical protein
MDNGELRMENQEGLIAAWLLGCDGFIVQSFPRTLLLFPLSIFNYPLSIEME